MKKVILFDFDGTIADSFDDFIEIIKKLSPKHNFPSLSNEQIQNLRSIGARGVLKTLNISFFKLPFIARDFKKMQQKNITSIKPFRDIPQTLHQLKSNGYQIGILTSNAEKNVKLFLKKNDIDIFDYLYTDSSIFGKDRMIARFLKKYHVDTKDVLYVGDEIRDVEACKKIGIKIVAVTWGFNTKEGLEKSNPDYIVGNPKELIQIHFP